VVVEGRVPRPSSGWGLPEGLYPSPRRPSNLAGCLEKSNSVRGLFRMHPNCSCASKAGRSLPPAADANRDGQPFGDGQAYRYPHATAALGSPRPTCRRPCKGKCSGSPAPWAGKGPSGPGCGYGAPPTGRRSRNSREQIENRPAAARPTPGCCGAGCNAGRRLKGSVSIVSGSRFWQGATWQTPRQVFLVLEGPFPASGPRPPRRHPEGAWLITVWPSLGAQRAGGQVQMLRTASPKPQHSAR